jgi:uncharacterized protein YuzE
MRMTPPLVTYDTAAQVYAVDLRQGDVARTVEFDDAHLVDLDATGNVLSIEVLTLDPPRIAEIAAAYDLGVPLGEILSAISSAVPPGLSTGAPSAAWRVVPVTVNWTQVLHQGHPVASQSMIDARNVDLVAG